MLYFSGERFSDNEAGMAVPESVCTAKSLAINVDVNAYEPHITAATMAHMIGHNVGMGHDDGREYHVLCAVNKYTKYCVPV